MKAQQERTTTKYNIFETPKKNIVWTGAMSLAWEELKNQVIKEPIKLQTKDSKSLQIVDNYNTSNFLKKDLSSDCYYVKSGFGIQTASVINKQVSSKFPNMSLPKLKQKFDPTDLIVYAYIFKKFDFLSQFQRRQKTNFLFNRSKVQSFYAKQNQQKKNVFYFFYENEDNFLIGIKGKDPNDCICLLKSERDLSVDQVIKTIIHSENKGAKRYLTNCDEFQMPIVKIEANRNIKELQGLTFANNICKNDILAKATQGIKIEINEKGAKMENAALLVKMKAKKQVIQSKKFLLNKTFWIVMKQRSKHPYLCLKIVTPVQVGKESKI